MGEFQDKTLTCVDCGREFTFTAAEQQFYAEKGFENEPKRCPDDRKARKEQKSGERVQFTTNCSVCGKECTVPFKPTEGRPVLCDEDFAKSKAGDAA